MSGWDDMALILADEVASCERGLATGRWNQTSVDSVAIPVVESGPTAAQRARLEDLLSQAARLRPLISAELERVGRSLGEGRRLQAGMSAYLEAVVASGETVNGPW